MHEDTHQEQNSAKAHIYTRNSHLLLFFSFPFMLYRPKVRDKKREETGAQQKKRTSWAQDKVKHKGTTQGEPTSFETLFKWMSATAKKVKSSAKNQTKASTKSKKETRAFPVDEEPTTPRKRWRKKDWKSENVETNCSFILFLLDSIVCMPCILATELFSSSRNFIFVAHWFAFFSMRAPFFHRLFSVCFKHSASVYDVFVRRSSNQQSQRSKK